MALFQDFSLHRVEELKIDEKGVRNCCVAGTSGSSFDQPRPYKRKAVSDSQLQSLARSIDAQLIYTSAATGQGVAELFQMVAEDQAASHGERISVERKSESRSQSRRSSSETTRQVERNDIVQLEGTQSCYRATRDACCK